MLVTQKLQLQVMLGLPGYKTVIVFKVYIQIHEQILGFVPLLFYKYKPRNRQENGGKWHVDTFLDNYFPFFSYVHPKGLFAEQIIQAKTSPSLSLDTYVLGNQLKFSPNPSRMECTLFGFLSFLPSLFRSPYSSFMCAFTLT